jgi:hypothetical protein
VSVEPVYLSIFYIMTLSLVQVALGGGMMWVRIGKDVEGSGHD